jgi:hypothetical protein
MLLVIILPRAIFSPLKKQKSTPVCRLRGANQTEKPMRTSVHNLIVDYDSAYLLSVINGWRLKQYHYSTFVKAFDTSSATMPASSLTAPAAGIVPGSIDR